MPSNELLYQVIYALAAKDGRDRVLFGDYAPQALEAFRRSNACSALPELWFELPLLGDPWFDLHALTSRDDLDPTMSFDPSTTGGYPETFAWFARQDNVRQLALSWDIGSGDATAPAIQLLVDSENPQTSYDFLEAAGAPEAIEAYRALMERLPEDWYPCYTGVFPTRKWAESHRTTLKADDVIPPMHVECIPSRQTQRAYADDITLLEEHLRAVGIEDMGETLLERCEYLARTPFALEFQLEVGAAGRLGSTFGASLRFTAPGDDMERSYRIDGAASDLMRQVEAWGLADGRWRTLEETAFAKRLSQGNDSHLLYCFPAFIKLRWRDGKPLDAKAYLMAGIQAR